ncbi:MAG: metallophosphoesterase [Pseudomonadota bacterium]
MTQIDNKQVHVLIIDDQLSTESYETSRQEKYLKCLNSVNAVLAGKWSFDIHFCPDLATLASVSCLPGQAKLAIVDMVLDEPKWSFEAVAKLDSKLLTEKWPLILVSAHFGAKEAIARANKLVMGDGSGTGAPSQFLMWSTIARSVDGIDIDDLAFIFDSILSRAQGQDLLFRKKADEAIDILHITDPHFGRAKWDVGALMSLRHERAKCELGAADFLAITGDIADQGTPEQYELSLAYFRALSNNKIVVRSEAGLPKDRVLLCPGNHDFSRRIALGANIVGKDEFTIAELIDKENHWVRSYAWEPYAKFEAEIAGRSIRWIPNPGYRITTRFSSAGIIFLEINVERYNIERYQSGLSEDEIRQSLNEAATNLLDVRRSNECVIVLAHRHEDNGWSSLAQLVNSTLTGLACDGPVLMLCGHEHNEKVRCELDDKVLLIRGIPPIEGATRPSMVLPVVNCVRLLRENGVVNGVQVNQFHQSASGWLVEGSGSKKYLYQRGTWRLNSD